MSQTHIAAPDIRPPATPEVSAPDGSVSILIEGWEGVSSDAVAPTSSELDPIPTTPRTDVTVHTGAIERPVVAEDSASDLIGPLFSLAVAGIFGWYGRHAGPKFRR